MAEAEMGGNASCSRPGKPEPKRDATRTQAFADEALGMVNGGFLALTNAWAIARSSLTR